MRLVLIGMAGVGKSFIGSKLAEILKFDFVDIDKSMKLETGLDTTALLEKVGDEKFLEIEGQVFLKELGKDNTVFAPGGSIIYCESFIKNLNKFKVIYLKGDLNTIIERIKKEPRGIVYSSKMQIGELFSERDKLYTKYANFTVDATQNSELIIKRICDTIFLENSNIC